MGLKFESIILNAFAPERLSPVDEKKEEEKEKTIKRVQLHIPAMGKKLWPYFLIIYIHILESYTQAC